MRMKTAYLLFLLELRFLAANNFFFFFSLGFS